MPNASHDNLLAILAHWFPPAELAALQIEEVTGGLSRASLWKVTTSQGSFCLRRWPADFTPRIWELKKIHEFMTHTWRAGFRDIPLPRHTLSDESLVEKQDIVWELAGWLSGGATRTPTLKQAKAAAEALARFHLAGASFHQLHGCTPGLKHRMELLDDLRAGTLRELKATVDRSSPSQTRDIARDIIGPMEAALPRAIVGVQRSRKKVPIQWCLADSHIGNFLFVDEQVTGIVDFATAGVSSVARDIARLVGSVVPQLANPWRESLEAYRQIRPLSSDEVRLIFAFHISGTIGAAANWLRWRFVDDLAGIDAATTQSRLIDLALRLESLGEVETALSAFYGPVG
jgi:Ser/Thr protein kinase RdoA (MazF antagonist)